MRIKASTIATLAFALTGLAAGAAQAASAADDLYKLAWRDYETVYIQDGRPMNDSPDFAHSPKIRKLDDLDKKCKAQVKATLDQEAPAQVGDDKTSSERRQRIARAYLTCMLVEAKQERSLAQVTVVVSHRRTKDELEPFKPGDKTSLTN